MALLVDIHDQGWMSNDKFRGAIDSIDDSEIRFYPDIGSQDEVIMLACDRLRPGLAKQLKNLKLVQKLGAGVDTMIFDPDLPEAVRVTRLRAPNTAMEMARYALAHVLADAQNLDFHAQQQTQGKWTQVPPKRVREMIVGVLGLGHSGGATADLFVQCGFKVMGWSRTPKQIPHIHCVTGEEGLTRLLNGCDYVISVLPSTSQTINLFDLAILQQMKSEAMLLNMGRGTLIVESELIQALDRGIIRKAVLDVFSVEPLPKRHPLWHHPGVVITPHVSGWDLFEGLNVVSENYHSLKRGESLYNEVDKKHGY